MNMLATCLALCVYECMCMCLSSLSVHVSCLFFVLFYVVSSVPMLSFSPTPSIASFPFLFLYCSSLLVRASLHTQVHAL